MEAFILLIVLVLLLISLSRMAGVKRLIEQQSTDLTLLRSEFSTLRQQLKTPALPPNLPMLVQEVPVVESPPVVIPGYVVQPTPVVEPPQLVEVLTKSVPTPQPVIEPGPKPVVPPWVPPVYVEPQPSFIQRFMRDNPDLEKFVGENLINKIGIAILVLGIGYFVKYAIDQQWINEVGRVAIGITAGAILLGLAHRLRQTFTSFSSVLVGGGLTILYFTIAIAFHYYSLFSQTGAFVIMVVITGFGVLLTLAYNRVELAVMTLVGGFATPFMVSTGEGNYAVLFTYILILDVGMLVLSYFKKWTLVHLLAYLFTVLLFGSWLTNSLMNTPNPPYTGALLFASLFYGVFFVMNLLYNLKNKGRFTTADIGLLISNTALFYASGMTVLVHIDGGRWQGLFTVALAVVNFGVAQLLYRRPGTDRTLIYLLIGLVVTFGSLAIPVQLEGNFITMFWALEAVLLLWLSQKSGLRLMATSSILVTGLMLLSLFIDWNDLYGFAATPPLPVLLNKAFITSAVSILGLVATRWLLARQETAFQFWIAELSVARYRRLLGYATIAVIYLAGALEVNYQAITFYGFGPNRMALIGAYNMLTALLLLAIGFRMGKRDWLLQAASLSALALVLYVLLFAPAPLNSLQDYAYGTETSRAGFGWHYVSLGAVIGILILLQKSILKLEPLPARVTRYWPWILGFMIVYTVSWELFNHVAFINFSDPGLVQTNNQQAVFDSKFEAVLQQVNKVGLPILWGICAFVFMYLGLSQRNRNYRILSLVLFGLTLAKLFLYDIRGISEGGRVAAFIILGVLLLVISFMYQRIKKLLAADQSDMTTL